jgi:hypothetical protein
MKRIQGFLGLFLLGVGSVGAVHAATYNVGTVSATPYVNFVNTPAVGSFLDVYNFDVAPGSWAAGASVENHPLSITTPLSLSILNVAGLSFSLFDGTNQMVAGSSTAYSGVLTPGPYHAEVAGLATGVSGGAYSFALAVVPSVPEADTWALFAAGLGLVSIAYSRRRK